MTDRGHFITFEGIDRSGKSTQVEMLAEAFGSRAVCVREPGGTPLGESIRHILKDSDTPVGPRAEALLFAAARAELVETVIKPALAEGMIVIADRYIDSSLAYQGVARGLGLTAIADLNDWAAAGLLPDLTILIEVDPERARARGAEEDDRFEDEGVEFQHKVAAAYDEIADEDDHRVTRISGDKPPGEVATDILDAIGDALDVHIA
ncbi:MAG: dTMP kinase [Solirubrobacterales bacterium]